MVNSTTRKRVIGFNATKLTVAQIGKVLKDESLTQKRVYARIDERKAKEAKKAS